MHAIRDLRQKKGQPVVLWHKSAHRNGRRIGYGALQPRQQYRKSRRLAARLVPHGLV